MSLHLYHNVSVHIKIRWGVIGLIRNNQAKHINLNPIAIHLQCVCCCRSWASISDGATQVEGVFCLCVCQQIELETLYKLHSLSIPLLTQLKKMHEALNAIYGLREMKNIMVIMHFFVILSRLVFTSGARFQPLLNLTLLIHCIIVQGQFNVM